MMHRSTILDSRGCQYERTITRPAGGRDESRELDVVTHRGTYGWTGYGYRSATTATAEGRAYMTYSGDKHLDFHRKALLAHSRDLLRNNAIYKGMIERAVSYITGNGFGLRVKTSNSKANSLVEGLWRQWWKRPEIRGVLTGPQVARMICRELLAAGDHGVMKTDKATLRLIEAEQIDHSKLTDGISKDDYGAPMIYYVCPYSITGRVDVNKAKGVAAKDFLFLTDPCRPSQTRGVPALQSAFPMLHRINDVCDSEAISWQLLARYAVAILREGGPEMGFDESEEDPNKAANNPKNTTTRMTELDYALIFHGNPGEKLQGIEHNIPAQSFPDSIRMFLRLLGLPIGLPLEIILLDWSNSNYSQSRAVLEQAYETFATYQDLLEEQFYSPCFEWKLGHWGASIQSRALAELVNGVRSDGTPSYEWIRPTYPWLDQLKEAQAMAAKLDRTLTTHAHVCKSQKLDREDVLSTREAEVGDAIEIAQRISAKYGVEVPWQPFAGMPLAVTPAPAADPAKNKPDGDKPADESGDKTDDETDKTDDEKPDDEGNDDGK